MDLFYCLGKASLYNADMVRSAPRRIVGNRSKDNLNAGCFKSERNEKGILKIRGKNG